MRIPSIEALSYWRIRQYLFRVRFYIFKASYLFVDWLRERLYSFRVAGAVFGTSIGLLLFVAVTLGAISLANGGKLSGFSLAQFKVGSQSALLSTIISAIAVIIGLYFTAITTIAGQVYGTVHAGVREFAIANKTSRFYVKYLGAIAMVSLGVMGLEQFGVFLGPYGSIALLVFATAGIAAFLQLGWSVMQLMDPVQVAWDAARHIARQVEASTPKRFGWNRPEAQNAFYDRALRGIRAIAAIAEQMQTPGNLQKYGTLGMIDVIAASLAHYVRFKHRIPTTSLWFPKKYVQQDWYSASDTATDFAARTGATVAPTEVANMNWLEDRFTSTLFDLLEYNAADPARTAQILLKLKMMIESIADSGNYSLALAYATRQKTAILKHYAQWDKTSAQAVGIVDIVAATFSSIGISALNSSSNLLPENLSIFLSKIDWLAPKTVYSAEFPLWVTRRVEALQPQIAREYSVESRRITEEWFILEFVVFEAYRQYNALVTMLVSEIPQALSALSESLTKDGSFWASAAVTSRAVEFTRKLEGRSNELQTVMTKCEELPKRIDWKWPTLRTIDYPSLTQVVTDNICSVIPYLSFEARPENVPDYKGQLMHELASRTLNAIIENQTKVAIESYSMLGLATTTEVSRLLQQATVTDGSNMARFQDSLEPLIDLIDLSGYLFLFSAIHRSVALRDAGENIWNKLFSQYPEYLKAVIGAINLNANFWTGRRISTQRTNWNLKVARFAARLPRQLVRDHSMFGGHYVVDHPSFLVQEFFGAVDQYHLGTDGIQVFVADFLLSRGDVDQNQIDNMVLMLFRSLLNTTSD